MSASARKIVITGFMGAGKTTVARALARRLNCRMLDLDQAIAARERRDARMIIDTDGEAQFRQLETSALCRALETNAARIIALGGGAWTIEQNRAFINGHNCFTVWLDAPFELCWHRIATSAEDDARPLARQRESARRLYDQRRALYRLAELRLEVAPDRTPDQAAAEIARVVEKK